MIHIHYSARTIYYFTIIQKIPMIPDPLLEEIESLKTQGKYQAALQVVNKLLVKDPKNKEALFQVADIEYRKWEIMRAEKPIDFLLKDADDDAMSYYIKWVLEMEKTHRPEAKKYFQKTLTMMEQENPEVLRCYGLCEYWSWNRETGLTYLEKAFEQNGSDAEIILNLIEVMILEQDWKRARQYITHYYDNKENLQFFDRKVQYYDDKIRIFQEYVVSLGQ